MFKKKYRVIFLIILLLISMLFNACQMKKKEVDTETIYLGTIAHSILYAPIYIAISQGFFEMENLNVIHDTSESNQDLVNSLEDNSRQIILAGPQVSILDYGPKKERDLINFAKLVQKDSSFLLSRKPVEDFLWETLHKKIIIGGIANSTPQLVLEYLLIQNELSPFEKVDIIQNIPKEAAVGAFKGGVGDFIHLLEPQASLLEKEGKAYLAIALGKEIGNIAYTTFITKDYFLSENPIIIDRFVKALYQAQIWCNYHTPEQIARELEPFFPDLEYSTILSIITRYKSQETWALNPLIKQDALDKMQEILLKSGIIAEKVPFENIVDNSFAQKAIDEVAIPKEYLKSSGRVSK